MSLLLEALKKAEKAKEEARRRAQDEAPGRELRLEPDSPAPSNEETRPVVTRAELPDIRQPLEILTDDIEHKPAAAAAPTPEAEAPKPAQPRNDERATAKKVFEAKFREPNPRLPFYLTLGVLGVCAVGIVGYFWYQLRPSPPLVNANPPRTGQEVAAAPTSASVPAGKPAALTPVAIQGLPPVAAATPAPRPAPPVAPPERAVMPRIPVVARELPVRAAAPVQAYVPVAQTRSAPQIHPKVESGYAAYLAGDFARSRADYQEALRDDAGNRDALLGLAAIDVRSARFESAEATYLRLLQSDPNDAHAQAGLIALRASRLDPLATESRVKNLLAADPGANVLHFTLGNQLAQQARWAEAQQEYFKAFAADPENADFAYNLAVSLEHLRQPKLALEYYRRAVALAEKRPASFELEAARRRVADLQR